MSTSKTPSAFKHGAFSKLQFLPGEDPQEFEDLKASLFAEYKPSGASETETLGSIADLMWRERRLVIYQYAQLLRHRRTGRDGRHPAAAFRDPLARSMANALSASHTGCAPDPKEVEEILAKQLIAEAADQNDDDRLRDLDSILTLDQLNKELDVRNKIQSMIDRLFKRFWQARAMKSLAAPEISRPTNANGTQLLELSPRDTPKLAESSCDKVSDAVESEQKQPEGG